MTANAKEGQPVGISSDYDIPLQGISFYTV